MFVTEAMVAGIVLTVMAIVFIIGMTLFRSKPVGYDTQFSEELAQLEQEVEQLEAEYDLDFDLSTQYQLRDQIAQRQQQLAILKTKRNMQRHNMKIHRRHGQMRRASYNN